MHATRYHFYIHKHALHQILHVCPDDGERYTLSETLAEGDRSDNPKINQDNSVGSENHKSVIFKYYNVIN